jgi:hypothetical protein
MEIYDLREGDPWEGKRGGRRLCRFVYVHRFYHLAPCNNLLEH